VARRTFAAATDGLERLAAALVRVAASAETARAAAGEAARALREVEEIAPRAATQLDDLSDRIDRFAQAGNVWAKELQLQLEAVRAGATDLEEFMTKFGAVVVQTEEGAKTIRELLAGLDLKEYGDRIREFIGGLRQGSVELGEVMAYLRENAGQLTAQLTEVFQKYREGKVTLEHLVGVIQALKGQFEGSELDALLDAILAALARGDI
jgi:methyl-accepting chemotaxis protein